MKRYIKAMAFPRKDGEKQVRKMADVICEHIMKCIIYGDTLECYNHWVDDELGAWFHDVNTIYLKIDRKPPKFKAAEYDEFIFSQFGEDEHDCKICLSGFRASNSDKYGGRYPDFEVTSELASDLFKAVSELSRKMCRLLAESSPKDPASKSGIQDLLHNVLDKYL